MKMFQLIKVIRRLMKKNLRSGSPGESGQPVLPKLSDQAAKQLGITVKESLHHLTSQTVVSIG